VPHGISDRFRRHIGQLCHQVLVGFVAFVYFLPADATTTFDKLHNCGLCQITNAFIIHLNFLKKRTRCAKKRLCKKRKRPRTKLPEICRNCICKSFAFSGNSALQIFLLFLQCSSGLVISQDGVKLLLTGIILVNLRSTIFQLFCNCGAFCLSCLNTIQSFLCFGIAI